MMWTGMFGMRWKLEQTETVIEVLERAVARAPDNIFLEYLGKTYTYAEFDVETTKLAHYLLPGCAHVEKRGTFTNGKGRVQKFMQALQPRGDARPEWEFLHELVFNVTGQDGYATIEGLFNLMAKEVPAFNGLTWAGLGDTGVTVQI